MKSNTTGTTAQAASKAESKPISKPTEAGKPYADHDYFACCAMIASLQSQVAIQLPTEVRISSDTEEAVFARLVENDRVARKLTYYIEFGRYAPVPRQRVRNEQLNRDLVAHKERLAEVEYERGGLQTRLDAISKEEAVDADLKAVRVRDFQSGIDRADSEISTLLLAIAQVEEQIEAESVPVNIPILPNSYELEVSY